MKLSTITRSATARRMALGSCAAFTTGALLFGGVAQATPTPLQQTVTACSIQASCAANPADVTPAEQGAVSWAQSQLGIDEYEGMCLQFVYDAYINGAGVDIGTADSAVDYWNANPAGQHPGDTNPPEGALVFWDATPANPYGHVGLAEGGDTVISSEERTTYVIHEFSIADRNSAGYPYLGWILPA